jgi:hypothetical protein
MKELLETKITSSLDMIQLLKNQIKTMNELDPRIGKYLNNNIDVIYNTLVYELHKNGFVTFERMLKVIEIRLMNHFTDGGNNNG